MYLLFMILHVIVFLNVVKYNPGWKPIMMRVLMRKSFGS